MDILAPRTPRSPHEPEWLSDQLMRMDGVEFYLTVGLDELHSHESTPNHFLLGKTRPMIENALALRNNEDVTRILDVGIFKGGSSVLYTKIFEPAKLVAIEFLPTPVDALTRFIEDNALADRLLPYYDTSQADEKAMGSILAREFPARDIDLIVDDASHFYFESRATVNLTLPYLRPDGIYIIEDWAWAHWPGDVVQADSLACVAFRLSIRNRRPRPAPSSRPAGASATGRRRRARQRSFP